MYEGETQVRKKVRTYFKSFVCLSTPRSRPMALLNPPDKIGIGMMLLRVHFVEPKENYFQKGGAHQNQF